jgi:uncharacterized membrane protein YfcA
VAVIKFSFKGKVFAMLPFDNRPWAKPLARVVIGVSIVGAVAGAWYMYSIGQLHIPEVTIFLLLLLAIIPPNIAVLRKQPEAAEDSKQPSSLLKENHIHVR